MPKLKLSPGRTLKACARPTTLYAVHIKARYGWIGDTDVTFMVLATTHDQARRRAAAEMVMAEGVTLPLDDAHFCETAMGEIDYQEQPEMTLADFNRLWQTVDKMYSGGMTTAAVLGDDGVPRLWPAQD